MWVNINDKPVNSGYICDQINEISFELRMETIFNVNDLRSFAMLLKQ